MRKIAAFLSIVFGMTVLIASTSPVMMLKISQYRDNAALGAWWGNHQASDAGDLAKMAYLESVPRFRDTVVHAYRKAGEGNKTVNLYLWGDSYIKNIPDSAYYGLASFHFGRRDFFDLTYTLDTTKKNILVLCIGERFFRQTFYYPDAIYKQVKPEQASTMHISHYAPQKNYASFPGIDFDINKLFNPNINQNIEYNLFSYNIVSPIRTLKGSMNALLFHRASGDVVISDDGRYLFLRETILPKGHPSSYEPLSHDDISYYISKINETYDHYKAQGFDEVYLSIIPSTASLLQSANYNGMIPKIQDTNRGYRINIPHIDVYSTFVKAPENYYSRGDTHWNPEGLAIWLGQVNLVLKEWDNRSKQ